MDNSDPFQKQFLIIIRKYTLFVHCELSKYNAFITYFAGKSLILFSAGLPPHDTSVKLLIYLSQSERYFFCVLDKVDHINTFR